MICAVTLDDILTPFIDSKSFDLSLLPPPRSGPPPRMTLSFFIFRSRFLEEPFSPNVDDVIVASVTDLDGDRNGLTVAVAV